MTLVKSAIACVGTAGSLVAAAVLLLGSTEPSVEAAPPAAGLIGSVAPAQAGYGTIKGKLVWGGAQAPTVPLLVKQGDAGVKDAAVCAATGLTDRSLVVDPSTKGVRYAFVYLARPKGANAEAVKALVTGAPKAEVDQKNCEFLPYATAVHKDQSVVFKSSDPVGHNVRYSGFLNPSRNIALPPNGQLEVKLQPERLPLPLACDIHPWMKGWVMIFDHPFFAITGEDGSFEIQGVPAGAQNLVLWQEKVGFVTTGGTRGQAVMVTPGGVTDVGAIVLDPAKVKK